MENKPMIPESLSTAINYRLFELNAQHLNFKSLPDHEKQDRVHLIHAIQIELNTIWHQVAQYTLPDEILIGNIGLLDNRIRKTLQPFQQQQ